MTLWYQRMFGEQRSFALRLGWLDDPVPRGSRFAAPLWGSFELWADGRCLTQSVSSSEGTTNSSVIWNLAPFFEWLSDVGLRLVNEDPFPRFSKGLTEADGCSWFDATLTPPILSAEREARWFLRRSEWRHHHALRRSTEDAVLPNVVFKRTGDSVEISWDNETWGTQRSDVRFVEPRGRCFVSAELFANVLHQASHDALREASQRFTDDTSVVALLKRFEALRAQPDDWRWLVHRPTAEQIRQEASLADIKASLEEHTRSTAERLYVPHAPQTRLLRQARLETASAIRAVLEFARSEGALRLSTTFQDLVRPRLPAPHQPWDEGNERAEELREDLGWGTDPLPDLATWLHAEGCWIQGAALGIPATVSMVTARGDRTARIHLNPDARRHMPETALATGLGHLLMDREDCSVEGEWEDWATAARARAFGVALCLPEEGVRDVLSHASEIGVGEVRAVMKRFKTGPIATTQRLRNLKLISPGEQALLASQLAVAGAGS
jgi:hypothetical protein